MSGLGRPFHSRYAANAKRCACSIRKFLLTAVIRRFWSAFSNQHGHATGTPKMVALAEEGAVRRDGSSPKVSITWQDLTLGAT
jgi:hypothetical protein